MKTIELKIKLKTLAAEAKIIRREEQKLRNAQDRAKAVAFLTKENKTGTARRIEIRTTKAYNLLDILDASNLTEKQKERAAKRYELSFRRQGLASHRRAIVGVEARHSYLAYGFLRGIPLKHIEHKCRIKPDWLAVERMIKRFSDEKTTEQEIKQRLEEWIQTAA